MAGEVDQLIALQQLINSLNGRTGQQTGIYLPGSGQAQPVSPLAALSTQPKQQTQSPIVKGQEAMAPAEVSASQPSILDSILSALADQANQSATPNLVSNPGIPVPAPAPTIAPVRRAEEPRRGGFAVNRRDTGYLDYRPTGNLA